MPIEGFDYKAHANNIVSQLKEILAQPGNVPNIVTDEDKKFIIDIIQSFCVMCGEALYGDPNIKFSAIEAGNIVQVVAEWTFHKSVDMVTGKVPLPNRAPILQVVALNVFNILKLACIKKLPPEKINQLVEDKVKQVYAEEINKLVKKGIMSEQQMSIAISASNLDDMDQARREQAIEQASQEAVAAPDSAENAKKILKYTALAIVLKNLPEEKSVEILNVLDKTVSQHVINYMKMSNLEDKIDHNLLIKSLEEIKQIIPVSDIINTQKIITKYRRHLKATNPSVLSNIALREREAVKDFILDTSFPAMESFSPEMIKSLVRIIEEKINDN